MRARHWQLQAANGLAFVPVGDFAWYDQILEWTTLLGAVPARFGQKDNESVSLDTLFRMGRGAPSGKPAAACEMTKWFDTNYHYIVPELTPGQTFRVARESLFEQIKEAQALGLAVKPVIPGPLTWLYLGKGDAYADGAADTGKLKLLENLLPVYQAVLARCAQQGVQWAQIDEPILALDLPQAWRDAFKQVYAALSSSPLKLLVATYFDGLKDNLPTALALPVAGLHVDGARAGTAGRGRCRPARRPGAVGGRDQRPQHLAYRRMPPPRCWRRSKAAGRAPVAGAVVLAAACLWTWTMKPNSMPS